MKLNSLNKAPSRALWIVVGGSILTWVFSVLAALSDMLATAGLSSDELWGEDAVTRVTPSTYLIFGAIAVFTLSGLIARRMLTGQHAPERSLIRAVQVLAITVLTIGLLCAAGGALTIFLVNFQAGSETDSLVTRLLNSYLPIVLYTALAITALLGGVVFIGRRSHVAEATKFAEGAMGAEAVALVQDRTAADTPRAPESEKPAEGTAATANTRQPAAVVTDLQRPLALAFTLPIVSVAVALIFGLIVYDITDTAFEAWVWVTVLVVIGAGLVAGTIFAARSLNMLRLATGAVHGAPVGADVLNLVLSIIFVASVGLMSLTYAAGAMGQLQVQSTLSLSAYSASDVGGDIPLGEVLVNVSGSDLEHGSEATLTLDGVEVVTSTVDSDGYFWLEHTLRGDASPGEQELSITARTPEGQDRTASITLTITEAGLVQLPPDPYASSDDAVSRIASPTVAWALGDLTPTAILMLLALAVLTGTIRARASSAEDV